jgi:ATP-dependent Clp protease ATP-binding subunit ClpA
LPAPQQLDDERSRLPHSMSSRRCLSDPVDETQPLVGRQNEVHRLIELLRLLNGKNPVLVGEPGVGKRTIVGELV